MNTYDKAHELAKAVKVSDEYCRLMEAKKAIAGDEAVRKMVEGFISKRVDMETDIMAGKSEDAVKKEQLMKMYELIACNAKAKQFLECYMRFNQLMGDVYKIIGEAVSEGMNIFAKE